MKRISIIIPIIKDSFIDSDNSFSASIITEAFSEIHHDLCMRAIDYEIIVVTDNQTNINLQKTEVFPRYTQIKYYKESTEKSFNDLICKGISYAQYDYIGVLGCTVGYLPKALKELITDIGDTHDVIATIKTKSFTILPFLFNMLLIPSNTTLFFKKAIWDVIKFSPINDKAFLLEFLKRAREAGFTVKKYQIPFYSQQRVEASPITLHELYKTLKDYMILWGMKIAPVYLPARNNSSMIDAGILYKKQQYITHTTLKAYNSALVAIDKQLLTFLLIVSVVVLWGLIVNPLLFFQSVIGVLSVIYLIDVGFNTFLVIKTLKNNTELSFTKKELSNLKSETLPIYSILCPLYKEVHILPQFIKGLEKLDWPKDRLDVIILLESDDVESISTFQDMDTPSYIRSVVVPDSVPKTKPKACNYGLSYAKGEFTVIYDAEDIPDPMQLKKAYLGFLKSGKKVACLQAKLNYYNVNQNLLTRFFTAEYSLWFDIILPSLHSLNTIIPLGGTSNHFRTKDLQKLHAWDPFNVTEDADLGLRLFKMGYHTAILDSVTLEEGNSAINNWIRQRSRWIKGYMQTYLVHTKKNLSFFKKRGVHALVFHLVIGGKLAFIIINPILWIVTILYFTLYSFIGPSIDNLYPPFVLYAAISSLIFGNYLYFFCYLIGCVKRDQWGLIKYVYLIPFYWILISIAGFIALYQLIFKPFYWEKTVHGLHLKNQLAIESSFFKQHTTSASIQQKIL